VKITIEIENGKIIDLILRDMLYTPGLHSNLIFILKICKLSLDVIFGVEDMIAKFKDRKIAILEVYHNKIYLVRVIYEPLALNIRLVRKVISLEN